MLSVFPAHQHLIYLLTMRDRRHARIVLYKVLSAILSRTFLKHFSDLARLGLINSEETRLPEVETPVVEP